MFVLTNVANAQRSKPPMRITDSSTLATDTIKLDSLVKKDTLNNKTDSIAKSSLEDSLGIRISPDALPSAVTAEASDSAVLNMQSNIFELYGNAKVKYEEMQLDAHQVSYRQADNIVTAALSSDSAIAVKQKPTFTQGQEKFTYDSLQYNFKSKRAIVRNARSQYGEGFVISEQVKRNPDQSIYGLHSIYTTCALEHPHFGINAQKIKLIPNRVVASGPANVHIEDVPTPLFLPFGLFPITQGQRSGFKIPTYTIEEQRGIGLLNGGYYFNLSEKADLLAEANFYTKGSWAANLFSSYVNRYRYNGSLRFSYAYNKLGEAYETSASVTKDFLVQWAHRSDPKSRPGVGFNASLEAGTSTYNVNNTFNTNQILQNQYQSNITYSKQWQNKPYSLTVSARHSQNTQSRLVDVFLPEINFFIPNITPFQNKKKVGGSWYDKINIDYTFSAINKLQFYDTSFSFNKLSFSDMQNGMMHTVPVRASYNIMRFINMNFNVSYREYWLTRQMYRYYNNTTDRLDTILNRGFFASRDMTAGIDFNTRIYGMKMFKKGKIAGIRHVLTPSAGIGYVPDYAAAPFNYGYRTRLDATGQPVYQSIYDGNIPGTPGQGQFGRIRSAVSFGIDNNLQMKLRTAKDSTGFKNIRLIDNFRIGSAYDFAADSFNFSGIGMSFATMFFNVLNLTANANFDPYRFDYNLGRRINTTMWNGGGGIARFQNANVSLAGGFRGKPKDKRADTDEAKRMLLYGRYDDYADFNIPFNINFSYLLGISKEQIVERKKDTVRVSQHFIGVDGDVNITSRWKVGVRTGYDFTTKQLQITSIDIYRDMHCWEMRISTIPFGQRKSYFFTLQVKATVLQDLKLVRRRDFRDAL
ncbi:hypothetical protein CAP35_14570 [Chitinophagaceae bacterium IBVUCB1]|nr:hypothetical protein CAP35_14570 [Chitinophagaceae bacterium IBVUCB1]